MENEIGEAKSEQRRAEKSSREARDRLASCQLTELRHLSVSMCRPLMSTLSTHFVLASLLIQLSLSSLLLLSIPTDLQSASPLTTHSFFSLSTPLLPP